MTNFTILDGGVNVPTFMFLFTPQERIEIRGSVDAYIIDFLRLLDDPRTTTVVLGLPQVQGVLMYMVDLGYLVETRVAEITDAKVPVVEFPEVL